MKRWLRGGVALALLGVVWLVTTAGDWPTYLHDAERSGASPDETVLTTQNVNRLVQKWAYKTGGIVAASPTVVGGVVYVGSWDGYEYALNATTGALLWRTFLGITTGGPTCHAPSKAGISSVATVAAGVVYVGGGDSYWYALDARTGNVLWRLFTGDNSAASGHYNWSSPLIANGVAYVGVASLADCPLVQGQLLRVDLRTHQVTNTFNVVPDGQVGGGIWTSPALDQATNTIYVTTGTWTDPTVEPLAQAILALDATTLSPKSAWQLPRIDAVNDSDWGDTPLLFNDAAGHQRVAAINKNGLLYAFDRNNLAAGPVWSATVAIGGQCPLCGDGSVSSGAFSTGRIYFAGGTTMINGKGVSGAIRALDPGDGHVIWQHGSPAPVIPAITYANGLIVDGAGRYLEVLDAATGSRLYSAMLPATFYAPPSVANGMVFVATTDGAVSAFSLGPIPTASRDPNCPAGWTCQDVGNPQPAGTERVRTTLDVYAGGASIGSTTDQFRFVSRPASGDSSVVAALTQMQGGTNGGQAGVMIRQRQDGNSPYFAVLATIGGGLVVEERPAFGAATVVLNQVTLGAFPLYLEVRRTGDWFQAAQSTDGKTYTLIPGTNVKLVMPDTVMEGPATASGAAGVWIRGSYSGLAVGPAGAPPSAAPSASPCPAGWSCEDVGNPAIVGDQTLSNGSWTVSGAGNDIGSTSDQFHFVWQPEQGDATLSARVVSQSAIGALAKTGLMIRQSVVDPSSTYYGVFVTPSSGIVVQFRGQEGLKSTSLPGTTGAAPAFLQVTRSGTTFCAFTSTDGTSWSYIPASCAAPSMSGTLAVGMAVTSRNVAVNNSASLDAVQISATSPPPPTICPSAWSCADIGYPVMAGSQSVSNGTWSVVANGNDIWGTWDQFHFVYQGLAGDGTLSARVVSVTEPDPWAKAGVMLRQSPAPDAAYYAAYLTPLNGITVQYRPGQGAAAVLVSRNAGGGPVYLRVSRSNTTFCAYTSSDGIAWTYMVGSCQPMAVTGAMLAGMAVTSHNATHYAIGTIDSVVLTNIAPPSPTGCPDNWTCADIGQFTPAGSQTVTNGTWSVTGGGADINGTSDQFHFAWQPLPADGTIGARVASQTNTSGWAKAGVMLRQGFDPGSPFYGAFLTPSHGVAIEYRPAPGAAAVLVVTTPATAPVYLEVARSNSTFCAYQSTDGQTWTYITGSCQVMETKGGMLAGLAVTSQNPATASTVTFDGVALGSTAPANPTGCPAAWTCADIGGPTPAGGQSVSNATWSVNGGGSDINGTYDQFHFAWQTLTADGVVSARVVSQSNTNAWAKAGVMLRDGFDPGSPFYFAFVTPGNGVAVEYRTAQGATASGLPTTPGAPPIYLEVTRVGNAFCAYTSSDGATWAYLNRTCVSMNLGKDMLGGLAVTSHNVTALGTVAFDGVTVSNAIPPASPCPAGWACADIGSATPAGAQALNGTSWTVSGGGSDIWGAADQFHMVWQTLAADGMVTARVASQTNTSGWAKAGVMLRQSVDPGAPFYAAYVTPTNGLAVTYRTMPNTNVVAVASMSSTAPIYLRVARTGITFCAYTSSDGVTWSYVPQSCQVFQFSGTMLAGLAVTSHDSTQQGTATFDGVSLSTTAPPVPTGCPSAWTCADIGSPAPAGGQSVSGGSWTITGGGADISGQYDQFHYAWQSLPSDGAVSARLVTQSNTNPWAKAGVMLRQDFDPGAAFYALFLTPGNGVQVQYRSGPGLAVASAGSVAGSPPRFLEVTRTGSTFCAYTSGDGVTWTYIDRSCTSISASGTMLAGLAVTSHNTSALGSATMDTVAVSAPMPPAAPCITGWTCTDVGAVTPAGAQSMTGGTWSVSGGGPDIAATADGFHFVWQTVTTDATLRARVIAQGNTDAWAKGGVMLRQSTDPQSPFYALLLTPANGVVVEARLGFGIAAQIIVTQAGSAPAYLEIGRSGNTLRAYASSDGVVWTAIPGSAVNLPLSGTVLAGLAVSSHSSTTLSTVTIDNVSLVPSAPPMAICPVGWTCADIGAATPTGSQSVDANGSWTIEGGGPDIWGTADAFHYVWQTLAADGVIQARIAAQQNINAWAKAGLMLRQSTDAGSPYYAVLVTPGQGILVQYRAVSGGMTSTAAQIAGAAPAFVRVGRSGNTYTAYTSADGLTWTAIPGSVTTLSITGGVLEGMAVSSHTSAEAGFATIDAVKPG